MMNHRRHHHHPSPTSSLEEEDRMKVCPKAGPDSNATTTTTATTTAAAAATNSSRDSCCGDNNDRTMMFLQSLPFDHVFTVDLVPARVQGRFVVPNTTTTTTTTCPHEGDDSNTTTTTTTTTTSPPPQQPQQQQPLLTTVLDATSAAAVEHVCQQVYDEWMLLLHSSSSSSNSNNNNTPLDHHPTHHEEDGYDNKLFKTTRTLPVVYRTEEEGGNVMIWDMTLFPIHRRQQSGNDSTTTRYMTTAMAVGGLVTKRPLQLLSTTTTTAEGMVADPPQSTSESIDSTRRKQQHPPPPPVPPPPVQEQKTEHINRGNQLCTLPKSPVNVHEQTDLFRLLPIAFCLTQVVTDPQTGEPIDYIFLDVNEHFEHMTGLSRESTVNKPVTQVLPGIEHDAADWIGRTGRVVQHGWVDRFTSFSQALQRWYVGIIYPYDENTSVSLFVQNYMENISMEQAARESEERHRTLFENMNQGVIYHDANGRTTDANRAALRILGLSMDQMLGKETMNPQWKFVRQDGSTLPVEEYPAVLALQGQVVHGMTFGVFNCTEQQVRWVKLDAIPRFRPGEDKPYQAYTIFTDLTEEVKVEQALLRAKEKAEEADQLKSAFLGTSCAVTSLSAIISNHFAFETKQLRYVLRCCASHHFYRLVRNHNF
eukprot:scaffold8271_cov171-Amphora_coffeaeformis.AAC.16